MVVLFVLTTLPFLSRASIPSQTPESIVPLHACNPVKTSTSWMEGNRCGITPPRIAVAAKITADHSNS